MLNFDYYKILKPIIFSLNAELSHNFCLKSLLFTDKCIGLINKSNYHSDNIKPFKPANNFKLFGLNFKNKIGLAAGLDKNGNYIDALGRMGFGFIEIGTVTPVAQNGNSKPRLWRLKDYHSIINCMGFNNLGIDNLINNVKKSHWVKSGGIIGINIGKNLSTPIENAVNDYLICLEKAYSYASYIVVNISSPNTKNLRNLQNEKYFSDLLEKIKISQNQLANKYKKYTPILVKISPDLSNDEIKTIAENLIKFNIDGVIATNTTIDKNCLPKNLRHNGGLSGALLTTKSTSLLQQLHKYINGAMPIIAVGGIMNTQDCIQKFDLGANLVQVYSGFIYHGPKLIKDCIQST